MRGLLVVLVSASLSGGIPNPSPAGAEDRGASARAVPLRAEPLRAGPAPTVPVRAVPARTVHVPVAGDSAGLHVGAAPDSADLHDRARSLQFSFERARRRAMPRTGGADRFDDCDEIVGRFCLRFEEPEEGDDPFAPQRRSRPGAPEADGSDAGEGEPGAAAAEPPEVIRARAELVDSLASFARILPGDGWILGQLVLYLGEDGRWEEALRSVGDCSAWDEDVREMRFGRARPGWWCPALRGLALHRTGRATEAVASFSAAVDRMARNRREIWLNLDPLLFDDADDVWDDTPETGRSDLGARLWTLADPLFLRGGNDRLAEHFARYTLAWIREDAENPYGIRWGWDLERVLVRYGPEVAWDRARTPAGSIRPFNVVGHHDPWSRPFLPPGEALSDPGGFQERGWSGDGETPRTAYAPAYARDFAFGPFQVARFRRRDELVVVAGYRLPTATEDSAEPSVRAALFLVNASDGVLDPQGGVRVETRGRERGALLARAPYGSYLASVEAWDSAGGRAGRARRGVSLERLPPDVPALSDLLLFEPSSDLPESLEEVLPRVRPLLEACPGEPVGVAWELTGLGLRRETVGFTLRMQETERGALARLGDFLGLTSPPEPVRLQWTEEGPERLAPFFRGVRVELPSETEPGRYRLGLEVDLRGREPLERTLEIEVPPPATCD